jgi:hypothetical protein
MRMQTSSEVCGSEVRNATAAGLKSYPLTSWAQFGRTGRLGEGRRGDEAGGDLQWSVAVQSWRYFIARGSMPAESRCKWRRGLFAPGVDGQAFLSSIGGPDVAVVACRPRATR